MLNGTDVFGALEALVNLKALQEKIDKGNATPEQEREYDRTRLSVWDRARAAVFEAKGSCLAKLKPGEPFFLLRGQDESAAGLVIQWVNRAKKNGVGEEKVEGARAVFVAMEAWPDRKAPD